MSGGKWYSMSNRRHWCFNIAGLQDVQVIVGQADSWFFHGLNTPTDGALPEFFPDLIENEKSTPKANQRKNYAHRERCRAEQVIGMHTCMW